MQDVPGLIVSAPPDTATADTLPPYNTPSAWQLSGAKAISATAKAAATEPRVGWCFWPANNALNDFDTGFMPLSLDFNPKKRLFSTTELHF